MQAAYFRDHGGVDKLEFGEIKKPECQDGEALIRLKGASLNHLDIWVREGLPGPKIPLPHISGCDGSGFLEEIRGQSTYPLKPGNEVVICSGVQCCRVCEFCLQGFDSLCADYQVMGYQCQGSFAQYVTVPAGSVFPKPKSLSFEEAASFPLVFITAHHMLFVRANLKVGETVLVMAAGSGVGIAAIQLAKLAQATVIATAGTDEKLQKAKALGADFMIHHYRDNVEQKVKEITDGQGVNVVVETVGGKPFEKALRCLSKGGRLVTCGATIGDPEKFTLRYAFVKQLSILGSYMGGRWEFIKALRFFNEGKVKPVVAQTFPLSELRQAQETMLRSQHFGKIVITIP